MIGEPSLPARMRPGLRLEAISIAWMAVEAAASVAAGVLAKSLLLVTFGVDSGIELLSAGVLYWRLLREARAKPGDSERASARGAVEELERRTSRFAGYLLYALALYVVLQAGYGLWHRGAAETSWLGIGVAVAA